MHSSTRLKDSGLNMFILPRTIHPQPNGAAERVFQTLKRMLADKVAGTMHTWRSIMPTLRMEYIQCRHSTAGYSPNELVLLLRFGFRPRWLSCIRLPELLLLPLMCWCFLAPSHNHLAIT